MTATAELMTQLQSAWQTAKRSATDSTDQDCPPTDLPVQIENSTRLPKRCVSHFEIGDWIRTPIPDRPGWETAVCGRCGVPIGTNPIRK